MKSGMFSWSTMLALTAVLALGACGGGADLPPPSDAGPDARAECPNPLPAEDECDFFLSCGCDVAAGEKCSVRAADSARACFQAGPKAPGEVCLNEFECEAGSLCANFGDSAERRCMKYCDTAHACPTIGGDPQACYVPVQGLAGAFVCGQVCDLRGQDCELASQACYPSDKVGTAEKGICAVSGDTAEGAACTIANDCGEGFTCVEMDGKCHKLCDRTDGDPGCTTGTTCQALTGHTTTGLCL